MRLPLSVLLIFFLYGAWAQQQFMFSQNRVSPMLLNPATIGAPVQTMGILLHRKQWINLSSAPTTSVFSLSTPLERYQTGVGLRIMQDEIYAFRTFSANALVAYKVNLEKGYLSMGLSPGFRQYSFNMDNVSVHNDQDPYRVGEQQQWNKFDIGAGGFYFSERVHAGISMNKIYSTPLDLKRRPGFTCLFHGAYLARINSRVDLRISNQTRMYKRIFLTEFSSTVEFGEKGWFGAGFRTNGDVLMLSAMDLKLLLPDLHHNIKFCYSIDLNLGSGLNNRPCHEIALVASISSKKKDISSTQRYYRIL